jgi:hypothetical protein
VIEFKRRIENIIDVNKDSLLAEQETLGQSKAEANETKKQQKIEIAKENINIKLNHEVNEEWEKFLARPDVQAYIKDARERLKKALEDNKKKEREEEYERQKAQAAERMEAERRPLDEDDKDTESEEETEKN